MIAVLYNSNFAMHRARDYLDKAGSLYSDGDAEDMLEETRRLESEIF